MRSDHAISSIVTDTQKRLPMLSHSEEKTEMRF